MKKLISVLLASAVLGGCSLMPAKTITRAELLMPMGGKTVQPNDTLEMTYYGADDQYDYFERKGVRYRVLRTENAIPEASRMEYDGWENGKSYRQCLLDAVRGVRKAQ